jgi:hypothetical protein
MYKELKDIMELLISSFWTQWHIGLDNIELQMPVFLEFLEEEGDEWFLRLHDHLTEMLSLENGTVKPFFVKYGVDFTPYMIFYFHKPDYPDINWTALAQAIEQIDWGAEWIEVITSDPKYLEIKIVWG